MGFKSLLEHVGHDLKTGLRIALPFAEIGGQIAADVFGFGPAYHATIVAVVLAEQKAVALKADKSGKQKLADVLQLVEPIVAQALRDAGRDSSTEAVTGYIEAVVNILNAAPAPPSST